MSPLIDSNNLCILLHTLKMYETFKTNGKDKKECSITVTLCLASICVHDGMEVATVPLAGVELNYNRKK